MHEGRLSKEQLQRWVLHRYYYQTRIPIKDALILSKSEDREFRRAWIRRIGDHDGTKDGEGGLGEWLLLARAMGLDEDEVRSCAQGPAGGALRVRLVRGARAGAVARRGRRVVAHRALRAGHHAHARRRVGEALPLGRPAGARVLPPRVPRATRDAEEALAFVVSHATTRALQDACVRALVDKCRILWSMLDAVAEASA